MSHHKDHDKTQHDPDKPEGVQDLDEGAGPEAVPATEQGRGDSEHLHDGISGDQVQDRDQLSQVNDPNLKR